MAILATCGCGAQQRLPNSYDGKEVKCLKCGMMVRVGGNDLSERRLQVGVITLVARCEASQVSQADMVLKKIAGNNNVGVGLVDRVKIEFGWSEFQLQKRGSEMMICEADYFRNPWSDLRDDIVVALQVGAAQAELARKTGAKPMPCTFVQGIQTVAGCFSQSELMMRRIKRPKDDDSGWFIGPSNPTSHDDLETILTYQLLKHRPGMLQALMLPIEFKAYFQDNELVSVLDGDDNEVLRSDSAG